MKTPEESFEARKGQGIPLKWKLDKWRKWVADIEAETRRLNGSQASEKLKHNKRYQLLKKWINDAEQKLTGNQESLFKL